MADLAWDADVGRLLTAQLVSAIRCLSCATHPPRCWPPGQPWLLETDLKEKVHVNYSRGPIWQPYMVEDGNLVTGQNPQSAAGLGERMLEILK